jgi:hypothetical protein
MEVDSGTLTTSFFFFFHPGDYLIDFAPTMICYLTTGLKATETTDHRPELIKLSLNEDFFLQT